MLAHFLLQLVGGEIAGVDDDVGPAAQRLQQLALGLDPVEHGAAAGHGVRAAGLVVAPLQLAAGAVDEQRRHLDIAARRQLLAHCDDLGGDEAAGARIEADGELAALVLIAEQPAEQAHGEVVDCFPADVFQHLQRRRLARAGEAGDEQDALVR